MARTTPCVSQIDNWRDLAPEVRLPSHDDAIAVNRRSPQRPLIGTIVCATARGVGTCFMYLGIAFWYLLQGLWTSACVVIVVVTSVIYIAFIVVGIAFGVLIIIGIVKLIMAIVELFSVCVVPGLL